MKLTTLRDSGKKHIVKEKWRLLVPMFFLSEKVCLLNNDGKFCERLHLQFA
jgi:hypothetical protein